MSFIYDLPLLGPLLETLLTVIAPFLVVLSIVVFIHELGHYLVGKWCGIKAREFSIGFGKELYGWDDSNGTRWRVGLLPLGGYVMFKGDTNAASAGPSGEVAEMSGAERRETLDGAPLWARVLTILAGPFANFLLTILIVFGLTFATGVSSEEPVIGVVLEESRADDVGLQVGDRVLAVDGAPVASFRELSVAFERSEGPITTLLVERGGEEITLAADVTRPPLVSNVQYGGPADVACVLPGDLITAVDGEDVRTFQQFRSLVENSAGAPMAVTIDRSGETVETVVTPRSTDTLDPLTERAVQVYQVGVQAANAIGAGPERQSATFGIALAEGVGMPIRVADQTFGYIGAWIIGEADGSQLNSLIGIANASGQQASLGLANFIFWIALISAAIGLMNLLPIPVLDGGHLVMYGVEAVRGKPVGDKTQNVVTVIGLAAVLGLMVFATANDLTPWFNKLSAPSC